MAVEPACVSPEVDGKPLLNTLYLGDPEDSAQIRIDLMVHGYCYVWAGVMASLCWLWEFYADGSN